MSNSLARPARVKWWALSAAGVLVLLSIAAFYVATLYASQRRAAEPQTYEIAVNARACVPNTLTVPAGRSVFRIQNQSDRGIEWEILDGVMVLAERENIAPGFTQTLSANLAPGEYAMTCGLLSNPHGTLHVTPTEAYTAASKAAPSIEDYIGPLAEIQVYQNARLDELESAVAALNQAVASADMSAARAAYARAHAAYAALTPAAALFSDLDAQIDARADNYEKREADPGFTGFHRIEYGLYTQNTTDSLQAVAAQLTQAVQALRQRIASEAVGPGRLLSAAAQRAALLAAWAPQGVSYAQTDLTDDAAYSDGLRNLLTPMTALLKKTAPADMDAVTQTLNALDAQLAKYRDGGAYAPYTQVDAAGRQALAGQFSALAAALQRVADASGV